MEIIERDNYMMGNSWIMLIILCSMALLAYVHQAYPARFGKLFRATFNERITRQVMREERVFSHRASLILIFVAGIVTSLNLALFWSYSTGESPEMSFFLLVLLAVSVGYIVRQGLRALLHLLLGTDSGLKEFNFVSSLIYKVLGLIMLPISICASFIQIRFAVWFLATSILTFILAALFRWYRGWRIGRSSGGAPYHLMIYLCTLEILPILVVVKGVIQGSSI